MELTQEQLAAELSTIKAELDALKATHGEVLTKSSTRKAKITELEAAKANLQGELHQVTVTGPLRQMCEAMSTAPELFQDQLSKHFKVELIDGKLALLSTEGKPVLSKDGKPVPFEAKALTEFLTTGDDDRAKTFRAITIASRASGGASVTRKAAPFVSQPAIKFGLR